LILVTEITNRKNMVDQHLLHNFIQTALMEDIGSGDHTSLACIPKEARGKAHLLVKEDGIIAGVEIARQIFLFIDPHSQMHIWIPDGMEISNGQKVFEIESSSQNILKTERLVLNVMQRMSGIATLTKQYIQEIAGTNAKILDTRKTTPLIRFLEKEAVRLGGGQNYRYGLYDRIMIKDNHVDFCGDIKSAIAKVKEYLSTNELELEITVEVRNLTELKDALDVGGFQRIMFDNFTPDLISKALSYVQGSYETEASGGINLDNIRNYAETGVQYLSIGALTHSHKSLDLSLKKSK
jgi:nicotinate-nucleotide pyrophosphorylase (carboxylating)